MIARALLFLFCTSMFMGCHNREVVQRQPMKKYKGAPVVVSDRIIAKPIVKKPVKLRHDLEGLSPEGNLDRSLNQRLAKFYERDIPTYKVEPEIKKTRGKTFSTSPEEEDAPLQIFLKPVQ